MTKKKPIVISSTIPAPQPTVEDVVVITLFNERERIVCDAAKLIENVETNLAMMRAALKRNDLRAFSRYVEPFSEALAARAELLEEIESTLNRAHPADEKIPVEKGPPAHRKRQNIPGVPHTKWALGVDGLAHTVGPDDEDDVQP